MARTRAVPDGWEASTILIVDDEEALQETIQFALDSGGYLVETAANGSEGLEKFGNGENWDLVLLDQRMPGMAGLELLRRFRRANPIVPILLVTAYGTLNLAQEALRSGASGFLQKPISAAELRRVVHDILETRSSSRRTKSRRSL
jgi:DNA-binding NtrC family response regulator